MERKRERIRPMAQPMVLMMGVLVEMIKVKKHKE